MSRTAVVILNYNGERLLGQFLPSVVRYSQEAKVIVADNASTDQSLYFIRTNFPTIEVIELDQNYGFCGGYNRALNKVDADYYVLLNSDIEVTPHWLTPLINRLEQDSTIAAVQPKILSYIQKHKFEHAGAGGGFIDSLGYPFCRGRIFEYVEEDRGQYDDERQVFWTSGACMLIRARSFHQFGGFDEDYFAHMEEIDLCWKLQRDNQKVFYCGSSTVYHVGAGTLPYGHPRKLYLNFRNGLFTIFKHLSIGELFYKLPLRILLDWLACFKFVLSGEWKNGAQVLRAHVGFLANLNREVRKRMNLWNTYPHYSRDVIKHGSIVFDYYLAGKKVYQ